jgi:hypothetical protein
MEGDDAIPTVGSYKGIPLEDQQTPERLAVVRREIDVVLGLTDPSALVRWAADSWHSPESRQLACAMAESMWVVAAETRNNRPPIDLEKLRASTAGLGSRRWRSPTHFCSDLDHDENAVPREQPLDEE